MLIAHYGTVLKQPESNSQDLSCSSRIFIQSLRFFLTRLNQTDGIPLRNSNGSSFAVRIPEIGEAPSAALD
jgi:hypothetical protein